MTEQELHLKVPLRDLPHFCPRCALKNEEDASDFVISDDDTGCDCTEHFSNLNGGLVL